MRDDWGRVRHKPQEIKITTTKTGRHLMLSLLSLLSLLSMLYLLSLSAKMSKISDKKKKRENLLFKNGLAGTIITSLWVVFGLSILNFKKLVNQPGFCQIPVGSNPRTSFLLINLNISFALPSFLEHLEINEHHRHDNMTVWWPFCSRRSSSERGKYQNNGLVTGALFFSSPLVKD